MSVEEEGVSTSSSFSDESAESEIEDPMSPEIPDQSIGCGPLFRSTPKSGSQRSVSRSVLILEEMKKVTTRLETFSDQLESMESRLTSVESLQKSFTLNSSSDGSVSKPKKKKIKVSV